MRQFEIIVAPPSIQNKAAKLRFIAIEAGLLLVGKSQALITEYCARHKVTEEGKEIFASGTWENGQLVFEDSTPGWKRDELREFLAGIGLELAVTIDEDRRENAAEMEDFLARAVGSANIVRV